MRFTGVISGFESYASCAMRSMSVDVICGLGSGGAGARGERSRVAILSWCKRLVLDSYVAAELGL